MISSTSGVSTRHIVSLTKNAEKTPETATMPASSTSGRCACSTTHALTTREEAGKPQVRDHDHHAEQQHDGVVVDGGVGLVQREDVGGDHQAGADDGRAGAVHAEARQAADRQHQISGGEDQVGAQQGTIVASAAPYNRSVSRIVFFPSRICRRLPRAVARRGVRQIGGPLFRRSRLPLRSRRPARRPGSTSTMRCCRRDRAPRCSPKSRR